MHYFLEILPLVEFFIEDGIDADEAIQLIQTVPPKGATTNKLKSSDEDYQIYEHANEKAPDPFANYFYTNQVRTSSLCKL